MYIENKILFRSMFLKEDVICVGICKNSFYRYNNEKINDGNS